MDKEVFEFWKETSPVAAFAAGLKEYAGTLFIPTTANNRYALDRIRELKKKADPVAKKWLVGMERCFMCEEPQVAIGEVSDAFFTHLLIEGFKEKHIRSLAEQSLHALSVQEWYLEQPWSVEVKVLTALQCNGAKALFTQLRKQARTKSTKDSLTSLIKRVDRWCDQLGIHLKKGDFSEVYPLLKRKGEGFIRKGGYPKLLRDWYDYKETPAQIEKKAEKWITKELPLFKDVMKRLAKRYKTKPTVEAIEAALDKHQPIKRTKLIHTVKQVRKKLQPIAEKEWVKITPKYDVRVIETPSYLVPFMPTAAMSPYGSLTKKPFCVFFMTTDKKGSPSSALPDVVQTTIHEEYGHCVNFMNSYTGLVGMPRLVELIGSSLETPITEGISFYRELESLRTFDRIATDAKTKIEKDFVKEVEKTCPFDAFVEGLAYVVYKWRLIRFLRALSDARWNMEKQTVAEFVDWAHKKTGLKKKIIYDQTFFFQETPGYAPCYSIFGDHVCALQKRAMKKGVSQKEFNTFIASSGFPARSILEKKIIKKFKL